MFQTSCLTAGQHDDPRTSTSVPKHLAQAFFLVWPQHSSGLQVYVDVRVDCIIAKVVLCQQGVLQLNTALLQLFNHLLHNAHSWTKAADLNNYLYAYYW